MYIYMYLDVYTCMYRCVPQLDVKRPRQTFLLITGHSSRITKRFIISHSAQQIFRKKLIRIIL